MSATAFAALALMTVPAAAADLNGTNGAVAVVRISSFDKSRTQILREIDAAAIKVCANTSGVTCLGQSRYEGERQLDALTRQKRLTSGRIAVSRVLPAPPAVQVAEAWGGSSRQRLARISALAMNQY